MHALQARWVHWPVVIAAAALFSSADVCAFEFQGSVIGVTDGDTLTVLTPQRHKMKVRIAAIDAPEKAQPYWRVARARMSEMAYAKQASINCYKQDRYGRRVCRVFVGRLDVALQMVKDGLAWHYKRYEGEQTPSEVAAYVAAENQAKAAKLGLWQQRSPTPPWEWRVREREIKSAGRPAE